MRNIKLMVLATITMLFMGIANLNAQENPSKMVIIRVIETYGGGTKSTLITTDAAGKSSRIELEKGLDQSGNNAVIIQKEIQKWKQEGYKITQLATSGETLFHTTIILEK